MSFGWLGAFRQGSWRAFRTFILRERKDISRRLAVIDSELERIGKILVKYKKGTDGRISEEREGFFITKGSTLEKLFKAYIALGGNPLDISFFFFPDQTMFLEEGLSDDLYPWGGVAFPLSSEPNEPVGEFGANTAGFIPLRKYQGWKLGGRKDIDELCVPYVGYINSMRKWAQQEIREKRNDLEARIVKLCDLREQLILEKEEILVQAFGGLSSSLMEIESSRFVMGMQVPKIVELFDSIFYTRGLDGTLDMNSINQTELSKYQNLWLDTLPDEKNTAL
jgi:hypothetical protein